jgi:hypothetical protein
VQVFNKVVGTANNEIGGGGGSGVNAGKRMYQGTFITYVDRTCFMKVT